MRRTPVNKKIGMRKEISIANAPFLFPRLMSSQVLD